MDSRAGGCRRPVDEEASEAQGAPGRSGQWQRACGELGLLRGGASSHWPPPRVSWLCFFRGRARVRTVASSLSSPSPSSQRGLVHRYADSLHLLCFALGKAQCTAACNAPAITASGAHFTQGCGHDKTRVETLHTMQASNTSNTYRDGISGNSSAYTIHACLTDAVRSKILTDARR